MTSKNVECCILGAGPAGLGTAVELVKHGVKDILIIDRNPIVGGLARTEIFENARFDVGPHRFFTKNKEVNKLWHDTLGSDFRPVDRITRIYYHQKYFNYPLQAFDAFIKLGPIEASQALFSFLLSKFQHSKQPENFEDWICQKFGHKLYETFFKTYTEKVWGIPCQKIGAEWAAQRIKGLDVIQVLKHSLFSSRNKSKKIKTLVDQFDYPIRGAGQMYERMAQIVTDAGGEIWSGAKVVTIQQQNNLIASVEIRNQEGEKIEITAKQFFSSIPMTHFFHLLRPVPPAPVQLASETLYYREHITVNLLVEGTNLFPDQWMYIHDPNVRMARLANYNNFSPVMSGSPNHSALSIEYFTFQNEDLWQMQDEALKKLAVEELQRVGCLGKQKIVGAWVVRETESYPTYYIGFREPYEVLKNALNALKNIYPIGRGGLYKYNNQDHSTYSGMLAARNYLKLPGTPYNLWNINIDAEYQEQSERVTD